MRTRIYIAVFSLLVPLYASAAASDLRADVARCAAERNNVTRLACYDELAEAAGLAEPARASSSVSKWRVDTETSRIDDSTNVFLSLRAESPIQGWPSKVFWPVLQLRCKENHTEAYVVTGMPPTVEYGVDTATVTMRLDKEKAFRARTTKSTDGEALFFEQPIPLIGRMMKHETLLFEFTPFNSSSALTEFELAGLTEASRSLRAACNW